MLQDKDRIVLKTEQEMKTALSELQDEIEKLQIKSEKERNQLVNEVACTQKVNILINKYFFSSSRNFL